MGKRIEEDYYNGLKVSAACAKANERVPIWYSETGELVDKKVQHPVREAMRGLCTLTEAVAYQEVRRP